MSCLLKCCCCCCSSSDEERDQVRFYPARDSNTSTTTQERQPTFSEERKYPDVQNSAVDEIDPKALNFVKKKVRRVFRDDTTYEEISSIAKRYLSPTKMRYYFAHLVAESATDVVLETADESECSFNNAWEKAMLQKRTLQRFETVANFPVKLILSDIQYALPQFASSFARMIQLEFGALHAALVIDNVIVEWDDSSLIIPTISEREWVFQARLQGRYDKFANALKPEMKESARTMDLQKQIDQVFEITKEKHQAISQLIDVIIHYNANHEYNFLVRNCQHFVIDAMKALGVKEIPQFTGVFQDYFRELREGKSKNIMEKFESHAALDEHVNSIIKPGLSQHDLEYLLCQYFMFHVSSQRNSSNPHDPNWECEEETCRMNDIEQMLERDAGSLLFTTFSLNN